MMIIEQEEEKCSDYFIMGRPSCHVISSLTVSGFFP